MISTGIKDVERKIRDALAEQWWRFQIGLQFLTLLNFALLVITASDKLKKFLNIGYTSELVFIMVPLAILGAWAFGFFLESYVKFPQAKERAAIERSPAWNRTFESLNRIEYRLERLEKRIGKT